MIKYVIAVVVAMAAVLGLLLYIGDASQLQIISTSPREWLNKDISLSSRMAIVIGLLTLLGMAVFGTAPQIQWRWLNAVNIWTKKSRAAAVLCC